MQFQEIHNFSQMLMYCHHSLVLLVFALRPRKEMYKLGVAHSNA